MYFILHMIIKTTMMVKKFLDLMRKEQIFKALIKILIIQERKNEKYEFKYYFFVFLEIYFFNFNFSFNQSKSILPKIS